MAFLRSIRINAEKILGCLCRWSIELCSVNLYEQYDPFLKSNLLTRHKKHVETGMSPNFDNDPYAMMICFQKNI